ncbi:MAG: radical SAM protein [Deltaproteobacteria bacterium]|nr:radical SAM protein [Deltaproteobacteria bacterium]
MDCAQTEWLGDKEYLEQFRKKVTQQRIPMSGSINLTHCCNLRCAHCYLGEEKDSAKKGGRELVADQWIAIIDEIAEAGCLFLLMTGGEPLLRKDFSDIYCHAKQKGLLISIFTNGTLVTDGILELFDDFPPYHVEISLYGATAATYENITGMKGSYARCLKGIQGLLDHHVNVKLKTILMTLNRHEFYDIENMAREWGLKFRFDPAIFPRINGDKTPLSLRVAPEEAVEKEFSDEERSRQWKDYFERIEGYSVTDTLYTCGTGLTSFHIDAFGSLKPCLMVNNLQYDLLSGGFMEGWRNVMPRIRERKAGPRFACNACEMAILCGFCPAFFARENGAEDVPSEYLCALGQHRFEAMKRTNS